MDLSHAKKGITAVPVEHDGVATLKMPDGSQIELPVLLDANGGKFIDVRKLHPRYVQCFFVCLFGEGGTEVPPS
jgi:hypothetical protein